MTDPKTPTDEPGAVSDDELAEAAATEAETVAGDDDDDDDGSVPAIASPIPGAPTP